MVYLVRLTFDKFYSSSLNQENSTTDVRSLVTSNSRLLLEHLDLLGCHDCPPSSRCILSSLSRSRVSRACISILPSSYMQALRPIAQCDPHNTLPSFHTFSLLLSVVGLRLSRCTGQMASPSIETIPARKQTRFTHYLFF